MGLRVVSAHLVDGSGNPVVLRGVNRSGTEYRCVQSATDIFDGPSDESSVQAITTWKVTAVRVPLNEACWLGLVPNGGESPANSGDAYKNAIAGYVALLQKHGLVPILDLGRSSPTT
jgi:hypothetical protein